MRFNNQRAILRKVIYTTHVLSSHRHRPRECAGAHVLAAVDRRPHFQSIVPGRQRGNQEQQFGGLVLAQDLPPCDCTGRRDEIDIL